MIECECGCGNPAPIARRTHGQVGHIKGQPIRFIRGHQARGKHNANYQNTNGFKKGEEHIRWKEGRRECKPYVMVLTESGYIYEHILVAEKVLGRKLPPKAVVHHHNGIGSENQNNNLVICEDRAYHNLIHARMKRSSLC